MLSLKKEASSIAREVNRSGEEEVCGREWLPCPCKCMEGRGRDQGFQKTVRKREGGREGGKEEGTG